MLNLMHRRFDRDDEGFTLIELMVVVLIIAILIAIAIPTFLGARKKAYDRSAQSSLRNAYTNAKSLYTDTQDYTTATVSALATAEPSLTFAASTAESTGPKNVSVYTADANHIVLKALSKSGTCFVLSDDVAAAVTYSSSDDCAAGTAGTVTANTWGQ